MPLSVQGNAVLTEIWDHFRIAYIEKNPGCNGNEVERAFLSHLLGGLVEHSDAFAIYSKELREVECLIDSIR